MEVQVHSLGFQTITAIFGDINFISSKILSWEKIERLDHNL